MRSARLICAFVFAAVLLFLAGLHAYWALGGTWGLSSAVPTINGRCTINATSLATSVVAFLLVLGALTICGRVGLFATGSWSAYFGFASWGLCALFLLRVVGDFATFGLFKTVHGTAFAYWDTHLYSPLCLILAVLAGVVASGP